MEYCFWGWKTAEVTPIHKIYQGIDNPRKLYDLLCELWCEYTCAPRLRSGWSKENITLGQCSITAFLAQDVFGGEVYGIPLKNGNYHCFNVVGGCRFDLTSEQFGTEVLDYENCSLQTRETHFAKEEKKQRYEYLKKALEQKIQITGPAGTDR